MVAGIKKLLFEGERENDKRPKYSLYYVGPQLAQMVAEIACSVDKEEPLNSVSQDPSHFHTCV